MVKKFINILIIFFLVSSLFAANQKEIRKYKILIKLCKEINDKSCELKYYSYLYDIADEILKSKIKQDVINILNNMNEKQKSKIKVRDFKKNWVYYQIVEPEKNIKVAKLSNNEIIKNIGLLIPLTGEYSYVGEQILKGVLAGLNFFSNPIDLKVKIYDTGSKNDNFNDFLEKNSDIQIVIGPVLKNSCIKFLPVLKNLKIPVILLTSDLELAKEADNIFVHFININDEMRDLCDTIIEDGVKNLAVLYPENNMGIKYKNSFLLHCPFQNIKGILGYSTDTVDFRNIFYEIGKIKKLKEDIFEPTVPIDGFVILDNVERALLIIPQIYFYDFKNPKIYGTDLWNTKKLFKLDKRFQKNITFLDCIDYNSLNSLKKIYYKNVDFYLILAYDSITIIRNLNSNSINELKSKKFNLISGETYFDEYGISHKSMKVFRINFGGEDDKEKK